MNTNKNTECVSGSRVIHISYTLRQKVPNRYIYFFWRNFWRYYYCTVFHHFSKFGAMRNVPSMHHFFERWRRSRSSNRCCPGL